ncbi:TRAP transporter substrate-binding protein DctP [Halothiobacillus sp.]|uniref:TRAP transporter substrate-binding protein n=1 Tax=Halothiobacillus sp. TaxID=1891311 RepID=UPI002AD42A99|nr:TRAP transporter substrate-binding protein DctP [Halothiobacillus sp.]
MKRREFISIGSGAALAAGMTLTGCNQSEKNASAPAMAPATSAETIHWKMVTTWPKNFPGLGTGANNIARYVDELSNGRLKIQVYGAGEIVPALEVFDAVRAGTAQMGHGGAYYWQGKIPAAPFFTSIPFGLIADEMNSWLYYGDGLKLWEELYEPFGLIPQPAGNTGVQMGGWFRKPIDTLADFKGLKMRMPGIGGEVLRRLGVTVVNTPGGELFQALNDGTIDAAEWVGPYNDLAFGFYRAAKYYYAPGWQEPGSTMEAIINKKAFEALTPDLQHIVKAACRMANADMLSELTARNNESLKALIDQHGVQLRYFSPEILSALKTTSATVMQELAAKDASAQKVYTSVMSFLDNVRPWTDLSTQSFLAARDGPAKS